MTTATLSSKFQILVPKDVREALNLKPGQKLDFIQVGSTMRVVPQRSMRDLFGAAAHVTEPFVRDRSDLDEIDAAIDASNTKSNAAGKKASRKAAPRSKG